MPPVTARTLVPKPDPAPGAAPAAAPAPSTEIKPGAKFTLPELAADAAALAAKIADCARHCLLHAAAVNSSPIAGGFSVNSAWAVQVKGALQAALSNIGLHVQNLEAKKASDAAKAAELASATKPIETAAGEAKAQV